MSTFNLVVKKVFYLETMSKNKVIVNLSKEEIIQQIRTNLSDYTGFYPSTTMVTEKMDQHLLSCSEVNHVFFEVEPMCKDLKLGVVEEIKLQDELFKDLHFIKYLIPHAKKIFLDNYLFKILKLDSESYRYLLDPEHFESNIDKLIYSISGTGFARDIKLEKYKTALKQHLNECKGPCKLNIMGYPICKKNNSEISDLNKMFCGFYAFLKAESSVQLKQTLFDMVYESKKYNEFIDFIAYNVVRNPALKKLLHIKNYCQNNL